MKPYATRGSWRNSTSYYGMPHLATPSHPSAWRRSRQGMCPPTSHRGCTEARQGGHRESRETGCRAAPPSHHRAPFASVLRVSWLLGTHCCLVKDVVVDPLFGLRRL